MIITGYASIGGAVEAMRNGADEYLAKPFTKDELYQAVDGALQLRLNQDSASENEIPLEKFHALGLVGSSREMQNVYRAIEKLGHSSATGFITGESGTGKEVVARAIHFCSERASFPFVAINCCSVPETLLESELFGYVKGAFTGATTTRAGYFQSAERGTLFLDEIGDTSLAMQTRLLRVLQDREVSMVGSTRKRTVDVRVIAATNKDPRIQVRQGKLREDLYYRLNVLCIHVPPMRERGDDILLLVRHFAKRSAASHNKPIPNFSAEALGVFRRYHWPGNVREVENTIQRLVVMCDSREIDVPDLPEPMRFSARGAWLAGRSLAVLEAEHINNVLASTKGNKTRAAAILGIDRKTLREKIKRYGLHD